jgi:ribosomal-protein-alanine N-acetyltransferase
VVPATLTTARLRIRALTLDDAPFIVRLLNEPDFIRYIGDRDVRTDEDARAYLLAGPITSYARHDFGLCVVELAPEGTPVGICGLLQRDDLPAPDIGFAFLEAYRGRGLAREAADAVRADALARLGLDRLFAIVNPDNARSIRLLEALGFRFERPFRLGGDAAEVKLFALVTSAPWR